MTDSEMDEWASAFRNVSRIHAATEAFVRFQDACSLLPAQAFGDSGVIDAIKDLTDKLGSEFGRLDSLKQAKKDELRRSCLSE